MTITQEEIDAARQILADKWSDEGECQSCGWHAALYEHDVEDWEIVYALQENNGLLELCCISRDYENTHDHRGVKIKITEDGSQ